MYFENFPIIPYDSVGDGTTKDVTNLLRRVAVRTKIASNTALYDTYDIVEGETPEMIAHKLYGNVNLHWVVLLFNNVTDRFHDWPMSGNQFNEYINEKYGSTIDAIHHYEITEESGHGTKKIDIGTVNTDYASATPITNREYEETLQDNKRRIRLLDPAYITDFVEEFKRLTRENVI
jgi:hypothetical protein|tara:strand:+ start:95 stop:625 length:531 start_codon:yes stop_codon:yes gene_type:complete